MLDHDYLIAHIDGTALEWGTRTEWQRETRLRFADPARTVIDVLDDPRLAGGIRHGAEIVAAYLDEHEPTSLVDYGDRLGNRTVFKLLGFIVESLGVDAPELLAACRARVSAGIAALDPGGPEGGRRVMRWGLQVNVGLGPQGPL